MARIKQIGMAAGTFSVALGIGFIMQNGDALASRFGAESAPQETAPFVDTSEEAIVLAPLDEAEIPEAMTAQAVAIPAAKGGVIAADAPEFIEPEVTVASAVVLPEAAKVPVEQETPVQLAALDPEALPVVETDASVTLSVECVPAMTATPSAAAHVTLSVAAPCHADEPFVIHHQGMMFTAKTDAAGDAEFDVPALAEVAVVIAAFENGDGAVATTAVPDFANYDRAVLQWQGDTSVMLSAYEGGANFGDPNHIYIDNPGDLARVEAAEGGYLIRLGDATIDDALMVEIYTFPTGMMGEGSDVMLVAEAEITTANCGRDLSAQSIQVSPSGQTSALDLTMVMPECDAVGDFLILQNMFEDLTLALK